MRRLSVLPVLLPTVCLFHWTVLPAHGSTDTALRRLLNDTLSDYNKIIRPVVNQSDKVVVVVSFSLISVLEFNEVRGEIIISANFFLQWKDEFMKWDFQDYDNLYYIVIPNEEIWVPPLVITNTPDSMEVIGRKSWEQLRVTFAGDVTYSTSDLMKASCRADVTFYPFDTHVCSYLLAPGTYIPQEIVLKAAEEKADLSYYFDNGAWTLKDTVFKVIRNETRYVTFATVFIVLQRQPRFIMVNFIIPIVCMGFLNIVIFFIPADSGEKISYSITMLLSIAVFITLVADNLPKTSYPMSIFSYYLLGVLVMSILIIFVTVFNLRIFHRDDDKEPVRGYWLKFVHLWRCACCTRSKSQRGKMNYKRHSFKSSSDEMGKITNAHARPYILPLNTKHFDRVIQSKQREESVREYSSDKNSTEDTHKVTWRDVSDALDKTSFVAFGILLITGTIVFFVVVINGPTVSIEEVIDQVTRYFA